MMRLLLPGSLCFVLVTLTNAARSMQDLILVVNINKIDEGMVGYFQCLHRHSRRPAKVYRWFFGDKELPMARKGRTYVAESATNHQLYVTNARTSDSGEYTCVANVKGRMANASNYLTVYCPITTKPMPVTRALLGGPATLKCDGECYEHIFWAYENGTMIDVPTSVRNEAKGSTYEIKQVTAGDNGTYLCEFLNGGRKGGRRIQKLELLVVTPVDEVNISYSSLEQKVGQTLEIICQANGIPRPQSVIWFNNSKLIKQSERITSVYNSVTGIAKLKIRPLMQYDSAVIECKYTQELLPNQIHSIGATAELAVTGKPNPPRNLRIIGVSVTRQRTMTVQLKWHHPDYRGGLQMLAYRILYWDENSCILAPENCSIGEQWTRASERSYDYLGLATHAAMCFKVQSVNSDGLSTASEAVCTHPVRIESDPTTKTTPIVENLATKISTVHGSTAGLFVSTGTPSMPITSTMKKPLISTQILENKFQVILQKPCSQSFQVNKNNLTSALARRFSQVARTPIAFHDLRHTTMVSLGGIFYYQAVLTRPNSEVILTVISRYIEQRKERLLFFEGHLNFLQLCPFRVTPDTPDCVMRSEDVPMSGCDREYSTSDKQTRPTSSSPIPSDLAFILVLILGAIIVFLAPCSLILCYQVKQSQQKQGNVKITKILKHPSISNTNGGQDILSDGRKASENLSLGRRGTVDSAVSGMSYGSSKMSSTSVGDDVF